jgi:uncharacterized protein YacL
VVGGNFHPVVQSFSMPRHDPGSLRRASLIARLIGAIVGLLAGVFYGLYVVPNSNGRFNDVAVAGAVVLAAGGVGMVVGFLGGPRVSVQPYLWFEDALSSAAPAELVGGGAGLVIALLVGALVTVLLSGVPNGIGYAIALAFTGVLVYLFVSIGMQRRTDLMSLVGQMGGKRFAGTAGAAADGPPPRDGAPVVIDTSVLIDGRILDVARTGFLPGRLVLPGFVLEELQRVADSGDPLRRAKGRRGLTVLEGLKESPDVVCEIVVDDTPSTADVDIRLIRLARQREAAIMTNDYNLNRIAQIEGVRVLNLNNLANALKPIVSTGETMEVTIVKEGKELHQGVGYLDDGTMVVVENGRRFLDTAVTATVTSVLQTPAGRMIFALAPVTGDERRARPSRVISGGAARSASRVAKR